MGSASFKNHPPHTLTLNSDGSFKVNSGDCLSKYTWAIKGNYGNEKDWKEFRRPNPDGKSYPIEIANLNLIHTGETLYYMPYYKPGNGTNPDSGNGQIGINPPAQTPMEFAFPMFRKATGLITKGNFLFQFIVTSEGTVSTQGVTVRAGNPEELGKRISADIGDSWATSCDTTITPSELGGVAKAFMKGEDLELNEALAQLMRYEMTRSYIFPNVVVRPTFGVETSLTPVILTAAFDKQGSFQFLGSKVDYDGTFTGTVKVGLSKQGWANVLDNLNIVLAVGATMGTVALLEWLIGNAQDKGDRIGYASWYARTYVTSVFDGSVFRLPHQQSMLRGAREMVQAAMQDVILDMRQLGIDVPVGDVPAYEQIPEGFWKPARQALKVYKGIVVAQAGGDVNTAESRLLREADARARRKLGV